MRHSQVPIFVFYQVFLDKEGFFVCGIVPDVLTLLYEAPFSQELPEMCDCRLMVVVRCAYVPIVGNVALIEHPPKHFTVFVTHLFRVRVPGLDSLFLDLKTMLIGANRKEHIVAFESFKPSASVAQDCSVEVPDVWRCIDVKYWGHYTLAGS